MNVSLETFVVNKVYFSHNSGDGDEGNERGYVKQFWNLSYAHNHFKVCKFVNLNNDMKNA